MNSWPANRHFRPSLAALLVLACMAWPHSVHAQSAPAIPSWLLPISGAAATTRQSSVLTESDYTAAAPPHEVISYYRQLFAAARLPFRPDPMGYGFLIRAATDGCDLTIRIRNQGETSAVHVTCVALRNPAGNRAGPADAASRSRDLAMEKFDQPVYPQPKSPRPPLSWPSWLVDVQGGRLGVRRVAEAGGASSLQADYVAGGSRTEIQSFYADLLNANGYPVFSQSPASFRTGSRAWVEGAAHPDGQPGRRIVIRIEITPVQENARVELRVRGTP